MIYLTLPYPPSVNSRISAQKRRQSQAAFNAFKEEAGYKANQVCPLPINGALCVYIKLFRYRTDIDIDNGIKILLDALIGICYRDDGQINVLHIERFEDKVNPRCEVWIYPQSERAEFCNKFVTDLKGVSE